MARGTALSTARGRDETCRRHRRDDGVGADQKASGGLCEGGGRLTTHSSKGCVRGGVRGVVGERERGVRVLRAVMYHSGCSSSSSAPPWAGPAARPTRETWCFVRSRRDGRAVLRQHGLDGRGLGLAARGGAGSRGLEIQGRIQITARQASPTSLKCVASRARPADESRLAACRDTSKKPA